MGAGNWRNLVSSPVCFGRRLSRPFQCDTLARGNGSKDDPAKLSHKKFQALCGAEENENGTSNSEALQSLRGTRRRNQCSPPDANLPELQRRGHAAAKGLSRLFRL